MTRPRTFTRHPARPRPRIVRLNIYGDVHVCDHSTNTSNLNSHNVENIYSNPNGDWDDFEESWEPSTQEDEPNTESSPRTPVVPSLQHGLTLNRNGENAPQTDPNLETLQTSSSSLSADHLHSPDMVPTPQPTSVTSDHNPEPVDPAPRQNADDIPSLEDLEDTNANGAPGPLEEFQRGTGVRRESRGLATRLRSLWYRFF